MVLKTIVVIGSRRYSNIGMVYKVLYDEIHEKGKSVAIMSGKCPIEDSVDNWAIYWAKLYSYLTIEVPPRAPLTNMFFERNLQMAHYADEIIAFIPRGLFISGTWNCINEFRKMGKINYKVFDEEGKEWDRKWKMK